MKTFICLPLILAATMAAAPAQENKSDKTLGEKTTDALKKAGEKTKEAGRAVVEGTRKAADAVVDAVAPDTDARKVDVKLSEHVIQIPTSLAPGKTAFVVHNAGKQKHSFAIRGPGVDRQFLTSVAPGDTKVLHVDLAAGSYEVACPLEGHSAEGMKARLTVK